MTFVSAAYDEGSIIVWEKPEQSVRKIKRYRPSYYFYVPTDKEPDAIALDNTPVKKLTFRSKRDMEDAKQQNRNRYESDFSAMDRILMDNYYGAPLPQLVTAFIDIEVDYNPAIGFAGPKNPYAPISAITIYKTSDKRYITVAVAPKTLRGKEIVVPESFRDDTVICETEAEMLDVFLELLQDADVISGWNSEYFDLPYLVLRTDMVLGRGQSNRFCFLGAPRPPEWTEVEKFGVKEKVVNIFGRVHLDYLKLFRKFTYEGRQSFKLDSIGQEELGMAKLHFNGSLSELYNNDFMKYLEYNRHDTRILVELDKKFKFIDLANSMVHEATVNFNSVFGSVQLIDTAIVNFAHNIMKRVVFDKAHIPGQTVEGALVMTPKIGLNRWVFSCDINSLYPSVYRSLNLSPEKIIGQFTGYEEDWREFRARSDKPITLRFEDGGEAEKTAKEWHDLFRTKKVAVSAYGTALDQSSGEGLVPAVLSFWFKGRKELQAKKKEWAAKAEALKHDKESAAYKEAKAQEEYYELAQLNRKILLNSTYGATLNEFCRFHDPRLGASTTGTGRQITTFMIEEVGELICGERKKLIKTSFMDPKKHEMVHVYTYPGEEIIYSDTDSVYASLDGLVTEKETACQIADGVVKELNDRFVDFMQEAFLCNPDFDTLIKANREVVAQSSIFQAKKKYMLYVVNLEGKDIDKDSPKALKTQGSDIKMSSTPERVKKFLKSVTMKILWGEPKKEIEDFIIKFRDTFNGEDESFHPLDVASSGSIKVLEDYYPQYLRIEKAGLGRVSLPGNARAVINFNEMLKEFDDKRTLPIQSGSKIRTLYLEENEYGLKSMAFPAEMEEFPDWFIQHFKVDIKTSESKMVDNKLNNIFKAIQWQVPTRQSVFVNSLFTFDD
jgi:DNA polymerase elongation subunit (family B)